MRRGMHEHVDLLRQAVRGIPLVFCWLEARKPLPPPELDALFRRLSAPLLVSAREAKRARSTRSPARR